MKIVNILFIIAFVILTAFSFFTKPVVHNPVIIEDAEFVLADNTEKILPNDIYAKPAETIRINVQEEPVQNIVKTKNIVQPQTTMQQKIIVQQPVKKSVKNIKVENIKTDEHVKTVKNIENPNAELINRVLKNQETLQETPKLETTPVKKSQNVEKPQPVEKPVKVENQNNYMTKEEEIIAWNKWRSDVQNDIMKHSNLVYSSQGSKFDFTFVADKFGNVSNIKVTCQGLNCNLDIKSGVKPAISRLQNNSILTFPRGTKRTSTVVTGYFYVDSRSNYSTPDLYSDYERVTR